jgi:hypothetical protein
MAPPRPESVQPVAPQYVPPVPQEIPPPEMRRPPKPAGVLFGTGEASTATQPSTEVVPQLPKPGMPAWMVALLTTFALAALATVAFYFLRPKGDDAPAAKTEAAAPAATGGGAMAKMIEIGGYRILEEKKKPILKFVVINHSGADLAQLALKLDIVAKQAKPGEPPLFTIETTVDGLGPYESKDVQAPIDTKLRAYELPDWQMITGVYEVNQK